MAGKNAEFARSFQEQVNFFVKKAVPEARVLLMKKIGMEFYRRLTMKSPVDTGRFRANWGIDIDSPYEERDAALTAKDWAQREMFAQLKIDSFSVSNTQIWICNNLPYSNRLEYGWSKQAPQGMVRTSLLEMKEWAQARRR